MYFDLSQGSPSGVNAKSAPCLNNRSKKALQRRLYRIFVFTAVVMFLCFQLNATTDLEILAEKAISNITSGRRPLSYNSTDDDPVNVQGDHEDGETLLEKIEYGIIKFFMARIVASHMRRQNTIAALMSQDVSEHADSGDRVRLRSLSTSLENPSRLEATDYVSKSDISNDNAEGQPGLHNSSDSAENSKTILLYTRFFGRRSWNGIFGNSTKLKAHECPVSNCVFTYDLSKVREADALIFHARDFKVRSIPRLRDPNQRYIWLYHEAPGMENPGLNQVPDGFFNWTYTYHRDSDLLLLYGGVEPIHDRDPNVTRPGLLDPSAATYQEYVSELQERNVTLDGSVPPEPGSKLKFNLSEQVNPPDKKKLVAWMVSHCSTWSGRELYVRDLMQYIDVDIYGKCGAYSCGKSHHDTYCYSEVLAANYKFYLSFENSMCTDYITEKVWYPLHYGLVPVVYGGARYEDYLPPHSYIDATKLTPSQLAVLLVRLGSNSDLYNAYHLWRKYWRVLVPPPMCELCYRLHYDNLPSTVENPQKWWQDVNNCTTRYSFKEYPRQDLRLMVTKVDAGIKLFRRLLSSFL